MKPQVIERSKVVFIADLLWPATMGGEMAAITLLKDLAEHHTVTALYNRIYRTDNTAPKEINFVFLPDHYEKSRLRIIQEQRPDVLIVSYNYWKELADFPCRKIAYVCYWTNLVKDPQQIHKGIDPIKENIEQLKKYDGFIASSFFTKSVLVNLGFPAKNISIIQPRIEMNIKHSVKSKVLVVGDEKHRKDVINEIKPEVIGYDLPNFKPLSPSQMADTYSKTLVLAHPTFLSESYCRTAVEAMKYGIPIVYTAEGNLPALIGHLAGIPLPIDATPKQWKSAVEQAKKEQWRGEYGKQRAAWIEQYDDSKEATQGMVNHILADLSPGLDVTLAVPDFPGCYTAVQHMVKLHNLQFFETIPNNCRNLLLGALSPQWFKELPKLNDKFTLAVWWHSNLNQSDFTPNELKMLKEVSKLMNEKKLKHLFVTDDGFCEVLRKTGLNCYWLPDVMDMPYEPAFSQNERKTYPRVAMLGDETARKNHATSLGAAFLAGAEANFFPRLMKTDRLEHLVELLDLRYCLHDYSFKDKDALTKTLSQMTCAVLPTHAETFCYAAAEAILAGIPIIGSYQVPFLQKLNDGISVLEDLNDVQELSRRILRLHKDPELRKSIVTRQFYELEEINFRNKLVSRKTLVSFLSSNIAVKPRPKIQSMQSLVNLKVTRRVPIL